MLTLDPGAIDLVGKNLTGVKAKPFPVLFHICHQVTPFVKRNQSKFILKRYPIHDGNMNPGLRFILFRSHIEINAGNGYYRPDPLLKTGGRRFVEK